jgi:hydrogenase-4 component A
VCPVRAITSQDSGGVALNETLCIGCKLCALACPFGALIPGGTPIPKFEFNLGQYTYQNTPYQADSMYLREFAVQERLLPLHWRLGQKTVAVKCDLCAFRPEGPACVGVCPHQALCLVTDAANYPDGFVAQAKTADPPRGEAGRKEDG